METELDFPTFMHGMMNAPWDDDKCGDCGGTGGKPDWCCNGHMCGCRGMPIDFGPCNCGSEQPSSDKIREWAGMEVK